MNKIKIIYKTVVCLVLFVCALFTDGFAEVARGHYTSTLSPSQNGLADIALVADAAIQERAWIMQIHERGFIVAEEEIARLERNLQQGSFELQLHAARAIIEEVILLNERGVEVRLAALKFLKSHVTIDTSSPIYGQYDFHMHSNYSDAYITASALVLEAYERGLTTIAVSDHDRFTSDEAQRAAEILGVTLLGGAEITAKYEGAEVHIILLYDRQQKRELSVEGQKALDKIKAINDEEEPRSESIRENMITYLGDAFAVSRKESFEASRGRFVPMSSCNALWKKNKQAILNLLPTATKGKDFLVNFLKKDQRPIFSSPVNSLTIYEVARLAYEMDGRLMICHPNELSKKRDNTEALERLVRLLDDLYEGTMNGTRLTGLVAGVEVYSHKAVQSGIQMDLIKKLDQWTVQHAGIRLLFMPGSDYHGKYSLPKHPLGNAGNYPQDDAPLRQLVSSIVGETSFASPSRLPIMKSA